MTDLKLVGFSGPPRSGKDTIGHLLAAHLIDKGVPVEVHALSLPMRLSVYALLGLNYSIGHYESHKDDIIEVEGGKQTSIRQEMIALSESHVKPRLGHGWWGRALLNRVGIAKGVVIITDMGFAAECRVFESTLPCAWMHVHRQGCDFSKDSRSYVGNGSPIYNDSDPEQEALRVYGRLLNQHGWKL